MSSFFLSALSASATLHDIILQVPQLTLPPTTRSLFLSPLPLLLPQPPPSSAKILPYFKSLFTCPSIYQKKPSWPIYSIDRVHWVAFLGICLNSSVSLILRLITLVQWSVCFPAGLWAASEQGLKMHCPQPCPHGLTQCPELTRCSITVYWMSESLKNPSLIEETILPQESSAVLLLEWLRAESYQDVFVLHIEINSVI